MEIKVLGPGCKKCHETEGIIRAAVAETGIDALVDHVTDIKEIAGCGVFVTPAVVVDGKVKIAGKVPRKDDVKAWLTKQ